MVAFGLDKSLTGVAFRPVKASDFYSIARMLSIRDFSKTSSISLCQEEDAETIYRLTGFDHRETHDRRLERRTKTLLS
ncbi:unnamed protein product [Victoria cruziana]